MPSVFISYRQSDAGKHAKQLYGELGKILGPDEVFLDKQGIKLGSDFPDEINAALNDSDVVVIVIGPGWLNATDADGKLRLEGPDDWVKHEVQLALKRKVPVIPVLVGGAVMPDRGQLPTLLKKLSLKQSIKTAEHTMKEVAALIEERLPRIKVEFDLLYGEPQYEKDGVRCYWIGASVVNEPGWVKRVRYDLSHEHTIRVCKAGNTTWTTTYGDFKVVATMYDNFSARRAATHGAADAGFRCVETGVSRQVERRD